MTERRVRFEPVEDEWTDRSIRRRGRCPDCAAVIGQRHAPDCLFGGIVGHTRVRQAHQSPDWPPTPRLGSHDPA
jgi:hypothetical protein